MPRSQCENENVQFVQELAEVDGPFESPININYRDLTKLELPSLSWHRSETCPQKMKITNTGHTVIISGKWKCERPYITGGPLTGKYVFSQIHFHWGQDECNGSEHQVCGEGFPLEMHVAHFKTDYLSQENALKEKDGIVVVVYLFKLQTEPNPAFKKILSLLPCVQQPCTSQAFEPRPLMSLLNPFRDDYFMYWGSVITPTCAHILLWIICREPFGISREQVEEFRKILDPSQRPICRNRRDVQPLHKRNVFHVNACREVDSPLLPIKQMLGCYCKKSEENINFKSTNSEEPQGNDCNCPVYLRNQEEIEGTAADNTNCSSLCPSTEGAAKWDTSLSGDACLKRYVYVHNAIIAPTPILAKKFESELIKKVHYPLKKQIKSEDNIRTNFISQSCFFPLEKINQNKTRPKRRKPREKKKSNSFKAFTNILNSLEALKNHTFKKLKEIDAINQEIKGLKLFCHNAEDKRWLRRIEKVMTSQKQFTIKKSQNCFGELKKLARECNFDKLFDNKQLSTSKNYEKVIQLKNNGNRNTNPALPCPDSCRKKTAVVNNLAINQATKFSLKAQKLIQSFFEDIKDSEDSLQKTVKKNLLLKKIGSVDNKEAGDSTSIMKGYITQKMFVMENLGDRFFTEVTTEVDTEEEKVQEVIITVEESVGNQESDKSEKILNVGDVPGNKKESVISLHKAVELPKRNNFEGQRSEAENNISNISSSNDTLTTSDDENLMKRSTGKKFKKKNSLKRPLENYLKKLNELTQEKFETELKTDDILARIWYSNYNLLTDSTETQSLFGAKIHKAQSKEDLWRRKSLVAKVSSKKMIDKSHCKTKLKNLSFEGHYLKKKKRSKNTVIMSSCDLSSTSGELMERASKTKSKRFVKAQLKLAIEKLVKSGSSESELECKIINQKRKMLKLDTKKKNVTPIENISPESSVEILSDEGAKTVAQNTEFDNEEKAVEQRMEENEKASESVGVVAVEDEPSDKYREAITRTVTSTIEVASTNDQESDSKTKLFGTTSTESHQSIKIEKPPQEDEELRKTTEQIQKTLMKKTVVKNKSLTSLPNSPRFFSIKTPQRLFVENLDSRRKCSIDMCMEKIGSSRVVESSKRVQEPPKEPEVQTESSRTSKVTVLEVKQNIAEVKCEADCSQTPAKQAEEELKPPNQIQREKSKIPLVRKRYGISGMQRKEAESPRQKQSEEKSQDHRAEKTKESVTNDKVKQDDGSVKKEKAEEVVFLSRHKESSSETVNSVSKPLKRKIKKRPSISKRSSKHIIRKNSVRTKKPNKTESISFEIRCVSDKEESKDEIKQEPTAKEVDEKDDKPDMEKSVEKEIEETEVKSLRGTEGNAKETPVKKLRGAKEKKTEPYATRPNKEPERKIPVPKQTVAAPEIPKEKPASPKPIHNFIKRNKQMAGKYKRGQSPTEKQPECKFIEHKQSQINKRIVTPPKERTESHADQTQQQSVKAENPANVSEVKEKRTKIPIIVGKPEKAQGKPESAGVKGVSNRNQQECEHLNCKSSDVALQKIPLPSTRFLPAYMMTSDLPPPMEIVQNQQKQMNMYLLNADLDYAPEMLKENLKKDKNCEFLYKKDLEYLLTLQRCLYGGRSTSIEKSMNYVKTLLNQEYNGSTVLGDFPATDPFDHYEPLHYSDSCNSGIVLIEMSDFLDSSTSNSDLSGYFKLKQLDSLTQRLKNKIYIFKAPQDSGDPGIVNPIINPNGQEDWRTDSNYDCQIFITLSANSNETEVGSPCHSTTEDMSNGMQEVTTKSYTYLERNSSQSLMLKQQRKKRKENEISAEMKQKLLEILETEIKREMGVEFSRITPETTEERHATLSLEELEKKQRSRSMGSLDNMQVLAEISETMREYLSNLNESKEPRSTEDAQ